METNNAAKNFPRLESLYTAAHRLKRAALIRAGLSGKLHLVTCPGEAHSNAHVDHCGSCAPRWGQVELPIEHASMTEFRKWLAARYMAFEEQQK